MSAAIVPGCVRKRRLMGLAAVGLLAAQLGVGCRRAGAPSTVEKLSIALPLVPHTGLIHLAAARADFEAWGLSVTLLPQIHGKAALTELLQGRADLAAAADVPFVIEVLKGAPLSIAAAIATASSELAVLARRDRAIASPGDLQGRRIAVTLGTSGEYFLWALMVRYRLPPQSLILVDSPPGRLVQALSDGSVDAIAAWQPVRHEAELAFGDKVISFNAPDAYAQSFVLAGRSDFLHSRQEALRRLMLALVDAERFARTDPQQAKAMLAERLRISAATLEPAWQDLTLELGQDQAQLVTLEDAAGWAMARGYAPTQPMPNFLSHVYLEGLLAASPQRVTVVR